MKANILNLVSGEWYSYDTDSADFEREVDAALEAERAHADSLTYMQAAKALSKIKEATRGWACWWDARQMETLKKVMDAKRCNSTEEAEQSIRREFLETYREWLEDRTALTDREYANKYGYSKTEKLLTLKDNLTAVAFFQKNIFCGRWLKGWENAGYERSTIWELNKNGFLSHDHYCNSRALASGKTDFYYVSAATAKQIYKDAK